ncbi:hypothetical protein P9250_19555 [Caballeronia sp. LP006]|jgi:hypothetical protein|uniref:hypothetical protein n=1 Tax=unclassified Caballeronia TaxID=2646786 RepID=UPI001FD160FD|nr:MULTISPECIES: hypothetical protein [unclassified Caballeronia]MDR5770344.1 hypothetical protein [Caballeronia sp. LZ002]MDR5803256.1 hypothetical protein [Caballeronia sp. LZ001]MDR5830075.1 hypothetical protein [Caballeronia sp. LP006]MDR5845781.1 hypothetical protein [Caballeronia sp. LZ003]
MLRWLIALLILANLLMFAIVRSTFGPLPAAGAREPHHLLEQVHPETLVTRALHPEEAADQPQVGAPAPAANVQERPLGQ